MKKDLKFQEMQRWAGVHDLATLTVQRWLIEDDVVKFISHVTKERNLTLYAYDWRDVMTPKVMELWIDATRPMRKDAIGAVVFAELNERISWYSVMEWIKDAIQDEFPMPTTEGTPEATIAS